jgi:hypothetical protein
LAHDFLRRYVILFAPRPLQALHQANAARIVQRTREEFYKGQ